MTFFKDIWEQGKMVVIWIRGHQAFAAKFGKLTRKSFLLPSTGAFFPILCMGVNILTLDYTGDTRFGTAFMLSPLISVGDDNIMILLSCCMTEN